MEKNTGPLKYKITISILVILLLFVLSSLGNLKRKSNIVIYKNFYESVQVFGQTMNDFNREINTSNNIKNKVIIITSFSYKSYCLNKSLDFSTINKNFNSPMKPLVNYLQKIDFEKLENNVQYLNEITDKLSKIHVISKKLYEVELGKFYKNNDAGMWRIEPSGEVLDYFKQINQIVS